MDEGLVELVFDKSKLARWGVRALLGFVPQAHVEASIPLLQSIAHALSFLKSDVQIQSVLDARTQESMRAAVRDVWNSQVGPADRIESDEAFDLLRREQRAWSVRAVRMLAFALYWSTGVVSADLARLPHPIVNNPAFDDLASIVYFVQQTTQLTDPDRIRIACYDTLCSTLVADDATRVSTKLRFASMADILDRIARAPDAVQLGNPVEDEVDLELILPPELPSFVPALPPPPAIVIDSSDDDLDIAT